MSNDNADTVMSIAISHWKGSFAGISSLNVSRKIGTPHDSVLKVFDELEQRGLATLNRDVRAISISVALVPGAARDEPKEVVHTILFPSKEILTEAFERERKDYGPYLNRLHKGDSQVAMYYFKVEVLRKYSDEQEKYHFDDDDMGGTVVTKSAYYFSLPEETRREETFAHVRYGKRRLLHGGVAVAAILKDLGNLPYKEQLYWRSLELDQPVFIEDDPSFRKFIRQDFGGEFVDHEDPIQMIYDSVERINSLFPSAPLFRVEIPNPYLTYPVINTYRAYNDAHKELCKVIGLDWREKLNALLLDRLLDELGQVLRTRKGEGTWSRFKRLVAAVLPRNYQDVLRPLENCRSARQQTSHDVEQPVPPTTDLCERFRSDCAEVAAALGAIRAALERFAPQK